MALLGLGIALSTGAAVAQTALPNPSCSTHNNTYVCIGNLDGTNLQQIIVGNYGLMTGTGGVLVILENTGQLRSKACINQGCPTVTIQ
jgi:hypothetical protein